MPTEPAGRRPLLKAMAGGAAAIGVVSVSARLGLLADDEDQNGFSGLPRLQLSSDSASGVASLDVRLGTDVLPQVGPGRWSSAKLPTSTHSMVALTWASRERPPQVQVSSRIGGVWRPWRRLALLHDLPDPESPERADVSGTELVWIGAADGIQLRVSGHRPADLTLVLLHPGRLPGDLGSTPRRTGSSAGAAAKDAALAVTRPAIRNRKAWGADERWRDRPPRYCPTIQQVHVHHTVNSNTYRRSEVPALLRGIYRYHTHNLGWSDIAYNFVVDRFGRVWTGRAGGAARPVRGAHTLGFNATSTGIAVLGNYELVNPIPEVLDAIAAVAAWKLDRYDRDPAGKIDVVSEGSDNFGAGKVVRLPVIDGHRDTNDTACPGRRLYAMLPTIRARAKTLVDQAHAVVLITSPFGLNGKPLLGRVLSVTAGTFTPADAVAAYTWMRDGVAIVGATGSQYRVAPGDVGRLLSVRVEVTKAGYATARQTLVASGPAMARPEVVVRAAGRRGRAVVKVLATAGLPFPPEGEVRITLRDRSKLVTLRNGKASVVFLRLAPGTTRVRAAYRGSETVLPARGSDWVTVK